MSDRYFNFVAESKIGKNGVPKTPDEMREAIETNYIIPDFRDGIVTVDKLLDNADVRLDWYIPSVEANEFMNFIRMSLGEEPENTNPKAHYFLMDCIFNQDSVEPYFRVRNIDYHSLKDRIAVLSTREFAKALTLDTELATPNGYIKMRDVSVGDVVIARTGKPTRVTHKSDIFYEKTYEITLADGRKIQTSWNHDNIVLRRQNKIIEDKDGKSIQVSKMIEYVKTTEELYNDGNFLYDRTITNNQKRGSEYKYFIPMIDNPIEFESCNPPIDPYTIGIILGDGSIDKDTGFTRITCSVDDFETYKKNIPYKIGSVYKKKDSNTYFFSILGIGRIVKDYIGTNIVYNKRIPKQLLTGSIDERISVLQGLMDTDGTINKKGSTSFSSTSIGLANDIKQLIQGLGGTAKITEKTTNSNFGKSYWVSIKLNRISLFRLERKKERETTVNARNYIGIANIEEIDTIGTQCITVDDQSESYVLKNGILTHNSTLIGSYLPLYIAAKGKLPSFGPVHYALYISDSMRNNVKTTMETIGAVQRGSQYLTEIFEDAVTNQDTIKFVRNPTTAAEYKIYNEYVQKKGKKPNEVPGRMKRTFAMDGLGASSGGRGSRNELYRPEFVIFDDMIGNEVDARSEVILDNIESTIESDVLPAMSGNGSRALLIGTPYNKKDPVYKRIEDGSWLPIVFPKAEVINENIKKTEFRGVWEDRHSFERCRADYMKAKRSYDNGNPIPMRKLKQEYYLRISSDEDRMIQESMIRKFSRDDVMKNSWSYNWYITTDLTSTGHSDSNLAAVFLWAVNSNSEHFLIDMRLRHMGTEEQHDTIFDMVRNLDGKTRGVEVAVETDGNQDTNISLLIEKMPKKNLFFSFAKQRGTDAGAKPGIRSRLEGGSKHWRFRMMLPYFQNGKIWFARELYSTEDMKELLEELRFTTYSAFGSKYDDGNDGISQLAMMNIIYPAPGEFYSPALKEKQSKRDNINSLIWGKKQRISEDNSDSVYDSYV